MDWAPRFVNKPAGKCRFLIIKIVAQYRLCDYYLINPKIPLNNDRAISNTVTSIFATRINPDLTTISTPATDRLSMLSKVSSNPEMLSTADFGSHGLISMYLPRPPSRLFKGAVTFSSDSSGFISDNEFVELIGKFRPREVMGLVTPKRIEIIIVIIIVVMV